MPGSFDVARVDLSSGTMVLDTENPGDVLLWRADNDFVVRAAVAGHADGSSLIRVRDGAGSPWRELDAVQLCRRNAAAGGVLGRRPRAVRRHRQRRQCRALDAVRSRHRLEHGRGGGSRSTTSRTCTLIRRRRRSSQSGISRERLRWDRDRSGVRRRLRRVARRALRRFQDPKRERGREHAGRRLHRDTEPPAYYAYDRRTKRATLLFWVRPALLEYALAPMLPIAFAARDGLEHPRLSHAAGRRRTAEAADRAVRARRAVVARPLGLRCGRAVAGEPRLRRAAGELSRVDRATAKIFSTPATASGRARCAPTCSTRATGRSRRGTRTPRASRSSAAATAATPCWPRWRSRPMHSPAASTSWGRPT